MLLLLVLLASAAQGLHSPLLDNSVVIGELGKDGNVWLDGKWDLHCQGLGCDPAVANRRLAAQVPGDLLSDLERAGVIGDPYYENNFKDEARVWNRGTWVYSRSVRVPLSHEPYFLVFEGIKMGAVVKLNDKVLETAKDQFLRYIIPITPANAQFVVSVTFSDSVDEQGRFMAASGGWDWAPYTGTTKKGKAKTMSKGIWKSVYLVPGHVVLTHVVPEIVLLNPFPDDTILPLCPPWSKTKEQRCRDDWRFSVTTRAYFLGAKERINNATAHGEWSAQPSLVAKQETVGRETVVTFESSIANSTHVELWWPNRLGGQPLYNLKVCFSPPNARSCAERQVGFRTVSIVTGNDTDTAYVNASRFATGSSSHGMYFRVNGQIIYARGANVIPMDEMEGRYDASSHWRLVENAKLANFNMMRVWGGGVFFPSVFYQACDRMGILLFHDLMYAQRHHSPRKDSPTQLEEIQHQVRRLSAHPSVAVWNACNECVVIPHTPTEVYTSFAMAAVIKEDISRAIWPSCPSKGWRTGVHRLSSLPIARNATLTARVFSKRAIEVHGPYQHGTGFPSMNGPPMFVPFESPIPPPIIDQLLVNGSSSSSITGPKAHNIFTSEFGTVTMSSFESMAATLHPSHYSLHGGAAPDLSLIHI